MGHLTPQSALSFAVAMTDATLASICLVSRVLKIERMTVDAVSFLGIDGYDAFSSQEIFAMRYRF